MPYDTGQWLELKRVVCQTLRMQRAVELEASLVARTKWQTVYIAMDKSSNECQLEGYTSQGKLATVVCCAEVLIQPSALVLSDVSLDGCVTECTTEHCTD